MEQEELSLEIPMNHLENIFGQFDSNIKLIERALHVNFVARGDILKILGSHQDITHAARMMNQLYELSKNGTDITEQNVIYAISMEDNNQKDNHVEFLAEIDSDCICHTITGKPIKPKTLGQKQYVDSIRSHMITFGIGPAGTGKTYLAMAMAIVAFQREEVSKIILTRPAIEAGEKLGFLPGDLQSKVDPYLRPLYDALFQIMGADNFNRNMEKGLIEVAPLAYMRGRTLENAFIILDEAQNTTSAQMKMFLTRIGFGSKAVITGDLTQIDLPKETVSGLMAAEKVLQHVEDIAFLNLTGKDVVRHLLVQKIVQAYEEYEKKSQEKTKRGSIKNDTGRRK